MSRLERYRIYRKVKRRAVITLIFTLFMLLSGIYVVDMSFGEIVGERASHEFFKVENNNNNFELIFLNLKLKLNTYYLKNDFKRLKNIVS